MYMFHALSPGPGTASSMGVHASWRGPTRHIPHGGRGRSQRRVESRAAARHFCSVTSRRGGFQKGVVIGMACRGMAHGAMIQRTGRGRQTGCIPCASCMAYVTHMQCLCAGMR